MTDPLTAAREALAGARLPLRHVTCLDCGALLDLVEDGRDVPRASCECGSDRVDVVRQTGGTVSAEHLRAALAEVDRLGGLVVLANVIIASLRVGLTQNQLAQRLQTHPTSVSAIERGVTGPSVATIERWLDACGFTLRVVSAADAERIDRVLAGGEGVGGGS